MTSKEFTIWLKGFITACNEYSPTPKQWDIIKEELDKISDEQKIGTPIGTGIGVPNIQQFPTWQQPHYVDPYNPFKVTCSTGSSGTFTPGFAVTTTPGYGSITYNPSTSTTYGYPSGSAWSYTNGGNKDIKE